MLKVIPKQIPGEAGVLHKPLGTVPQPTQSLSNNHGGKLSKGHKNKHKNSKYKIQI